MTGFNDQLEGGIKLKLKFLGIVGTRESGDTENLTKEILRSASEEGAETDLIFLNDFEIYPCANCGACLDSGKCIIDDDVEALIQKISEVDGIVFGSHESFNSPTSKDKSFITRIEFLGLHEDRRAFKNKVAATVAADKNTGFKILTSLIDLRMIIPGGGIIGGFKVELELPRAKELGKSMVQLANITKDMRKI